MVLTFATISTTAREICIHQPDTPLALAEALDPKGLYKKARRGELKNFTGIDAPYEVPESPELRIDTAGQSLEQAAEQVVAALRAAGLLAPAD